MTTTFDDSKLGFSDDESSDEDDLETIKSKLAQIRQKEKKEKERVNGNRSSGGSQTQGTGIGTGTGTGGDDDLFDDEDEEDPNGSTGSGSGSRNSKESKSTFKNGGMSDEDELDIESEDEQEEMQVLNLAGQSLTEIPQHIAKSKGTSVKKLILTKNQLKSLKNLEYFDGLEELYLDRNGLESIDDIPKLPQLKTLWLNNNKLSDILSMAQVLTKNCPRVSYLSLLRNPICPSIYFNHGNESRYRRYRYQVLFNLPGLTYLDTTEVSIEEMKEAQEKGKYLVNVAKPSKKQMKEVDKEYDIKKQNSDINKEVKFKQSQPAAYLGRGRIKYDGRESEGNRFILNQDL